MSKAESLDLPPAEKNWEDKKLFLEAQTQHYQERWQVSVVIAKRWAKGDWPIILKRQSRQF
ncbi:MAG: hypothetical protein WDZ85_01595 [Candidatus Paceibacterota bacterium]